jgi:DNA-binding MarR family transcriptional regulator
MSTKKALTQRIQALEHTTDVLAQVVTEQGNLIHRLKTMSSTSPARKRVSTKAIEPFAPLSLRQVEMLEVFAQGNQLTPQQAAEAIGYPTASGQTIVSDLKKAGLIQPTGEYLKMSHRGRNPAILQITELGQRTAERNAVISKNLEIKNG